MSKKELTPQQRNAMIGDRVLVVLSVSTLVLVALFAQSIKIAFG